jgi:hypothetical protein
MEESSRGVGASPYATQHCAPSGSAVVSSGRVIHNGAVVFRAKTYSLPRRESVSSLIPTFRTLFRTPPRAAT